MGQSSAFLLDYQDNETGTWLHLRYKDGRADNLLILIRISQ